MSALGAFCTQLISFFEDLCETYPEEKDIQVATQAIKLAKQANPRMVHTYFMDFVYNEFAPHILNEDEDYIIKRAKEMLDSQYSNFGYAFWIFDKHWSTMSTTNKKHVWDYIKSIILLAQRVPPS